MSSFFSSLVKPALLVIPCAVVFKGNLTEQHNEVRIIAPGQSPGLQYTAVPSPNELSEP